MIRAAFICAAITLACLVGLGLWNWQFSVSLALLCTAGVIWLFWSHDRVSNWPPVVIAGLVFIAIGMAVWGVVGWNF